MGVLTQTQANRLKNGIGILQSLLILGGMMIVGLFIASSVISLTSGGELNREAVLWGSVAQNALAFILPAALLPSFIGRNTGEWLNIKPHGNLRVYIGLILMIAASLPAMHVLIDLNESLRFPESMSSFEQTLRAMEEKGSASSALVLANNTVGQLIVSVLAVGVLTGIGEEFFFRAGVQNILTRFGLRPIWAIAIAAAIFSAAHFQFFGFFPRLVLGAWFGWLYWRYRSIWPAATAHALNNTLVVVSTWAIDRGYLSSDFEMYGVPESRGWIMAIASIGLCMLVFRLFFKKTGGDRE